MAAQRYLLIPPRPSRCAGRLAAAAGALAGRRHQEGGRHQGHGKQHGKDVAGLIKVVQSDLGTRVGQPDPPEQAQASQKHRCPDTQQVQEDRSLPALAGPLETAAGAGYPCPGKQTPGQKQGGAGDGYHEQETDDELRDPVDAGGRREHPASVGNVADEVAEPKVSQYARRHPPEPVPPHRPGVGLGVLGGQVIPVPHAAHGHPERLLFGQPAVQELPYLIVQVASQLLQVRFLEGPAASQVAEPPGGGFPGVSQCRHRSPPRRGPGFRRPPSTNRMVTSAMASTSEKTRACAAIVSLYAFKRASV